VGLPHVTSTVIFMASILTILFIISWFKLWSIYVIINILIGYFVSGSIKNCYVFALTPEIGCNKTAMVLPPVTSAVFLIAN
jgi:hypothetical protein